MDFLGSCVNLLLVSSQISLSSERPSAQFAVKCCNVLIYSDLMNRQRMSSQGVVVLEGFRTMVALFSSCSVFRMTIAKAVMTAENPLVQKAFPTIQALNSQILLLDIICQGVDFFISGVQSFDMGIQTFILPESFVTKFAVDSFHFFLKFDIMLG